METVQNSKGATPVALLLLVHSPSVRLYAMRNSPEQGGVQRGEHLVEKAGETLHTIALTDSRVQVFLARLAFPGDPQAMMKWIEGDEASLSSRFRAFVEDTSHTPAGDQVDIQNQEALAVLLEGVKNHEPERTMQVRSTLKCTTPDF